MGNVTPINTPSRGQHHADSLKQTAAELASLSNEHSPDMVIIMQVHSKQGLVLVEVSDPVHQGQNMLALRGALQTALFESFMEPIEAPLAPGTE